MYVVVPIKNFQHAKQRLATVLTESERSSLMQCMLDDVLTAIDQSADLQGADLQGAELQQGPQHDPQQNTVSVKGILVVTEDSEVIEWVNTWREDSKLPLTILDQPIAYLCDANLGEEGLCRAYNTAANYLVAAGISTMLFLPADIPLISATDIQQLLAAQLLAMQSSGDSKNVTLARAGSDGGTNALLVSPPNLIAPAFGHNSCEQHAMAAKKQGVEPVVLNMPALELDIDTPDDMHCFMRTGGLRCNIEPSESNSVLSESTASPCKTWAYLQASGIAHRCLDDKCRPDFSASKTQ